MSIGAAVDQVDKASWVEAVPVHGLSASGLLWVGGSSCRNVEVTLSPLARGVVTVERLGRGPCVRLCSCPPRGSRSVAALCRLAEGRVVVSRQMEGVGAVAHTARVRKTAASGVGLGWASPVDADEEGQCSGVDKTRSVCAVSHHVVKILPWPLLGFAHEEGDRTPSAGLVVKAVWWVRRDGVPRGVRR